MNDRLLFRVYDLVNHCYLPTENGLYFKIEDKRSVRSVTWFIGRKEYLVEQCTGLRDVNNKLIYENDKVEVDEFNFDGSSEELTGTIIFDGVGYILRVDNKDKNKETREEQLYQFYAEGLIPQYIEKIEDDDERKYDFFVQNNLNGGL